MMTIEELQALMLSITAAGKRLTEMGLTPSLGSKVFADSPEMLGLLRRHEWSGSADYGAASCCEECGEYGSKTYPGKHDETCEWGALLDKYGRT